MKPQSIPASGRQSITIPYDGFVLGAVVCELSALLRGGRIQDIRHPETNELHIGIHTNSVTHRLLVSIDARFARLHLTNQKALNSAVPTEFCSALRRHVEGARVESVSQVGVDRIAELVVVSDTGDGKKTRHRLIVELMGKHSNIVLVDGRGRIVESARRISHRINRVRETLPGLTYTRPPGVYETSPSSLAQLTQSISDEAGPSPTNELLASAIRKEAPFVSPFLAAEIALRCTAEERDVAAYRVRFGEAAFTGQTSGGIRGRVQAVLEIVFDRHDHAPVIAPGCRGACAYPMPLMQVPADAQSPTRSLNEALDAGYAEFLSRYQKREVEDQLLAEIGREIARQFRTSESVKRTLEEAARADQLSQSAELLLANLWQINPGDAEVTVTDYYDENGGERTIRLKPELSSQENAAALFDTARRARLGTETARARLSATTDTIKGLSEARSKLQALIDDPTKEMAIIQEYARSLIRDGLLREAPDQESKSASQFQGHRIRREMTPDGYEILVGESATANDFLTTRVARPDDLWLHVRSAVGGHVVIRTNGKPDTVPERVLERAAIIGARHSAQKHSSLVAVDYTLKKYVRKPRGSAPGAVVIEREKTLHVSPGDV